MADGNEELRADDLPGPAYEGYEPMELACPAERSGHIAVSDGRHMFVWGGYKVSGWPRRCGRLPAVTWVRVGGPPRRDSTRGFLFPDVFPFACGSPPRSPPARPQAPGLLSRRLAPGRARGPAPPPAPVLPAFGALRGTWERLFGGGHVGRRLTARRVFV